jgi:hypothetical protein
MGPVTDKVVILCRETPGHSEMSAKKIAEFLGAEATIVSVAHARDAESIRRVVPRCPALIVHLDTLVALADEFEAGEQELLALTDLSAHVFVYGGKANERYDSILGVLSSGGLSGLQSLATTDLSFSLSNDYRQWCGALSGLTFSAANPAWDSGFVEGAARASLSVLVRAGSKPFFARVEHGGSGLFFAACGQLGDPDEETPSEAGLLPWFSRLAPLMIFLRSALGDRLWHNDSPRACFIIDDPLLKRRYGFLKYSRLLETAGKEKFCACIAFIPWNYRRSNKEIVKMFSSSSASLSLCIHGCDHTRGEFAATSRELLRDKARLALDRMNTHSELYGLPFDDVMVFPQGLFSSEALKALEDCGYLAAVNTTLRPSDETPVLTLGELMDVAVTKFGGAPLFARHYPREVAEFAFDLFLGKPALFVEHHGYFRNGYAELASFIQSINKLEEGLEWRNLATICSRASLRKTMPNGEVHLRFYTNRFCVTNGGIRPQVYNLERRWAVQRPAPKVTLNCRPWSGELKDCLLTMTFSLEPGESADIRIAFEATEKPAGQAWRPTNAHNTRVLVRRMLSEFRDDHVETNSLLRKLLANVRNLRSKGKRGESSVSGYAN